MQDGCGSVAVICGCQQPNVNDVGAQTNKYAHKYKVNTRTHAYKYKLIRVCVCVRKCAAETTEEMSAGSEPWREATDFGSTLPAT